MVEERFGKTAEELLIPEPAWEGCLTEWNTRLPDLREAVSVKSFAPVEWTPKLEQYLTSVMEDYIQVFHIEQLSLKQMGQDKKMLGDEEAARDLRNHRLAAIDTLKTKVALHALAHLQGDAFHFTQDQAVKVLSQTIIQTLNSYGTATGQIHQIYPAVEHGDTPQRIITKVEEAARLCEAELAKSM